MGRQIYTLSYPAARNQAQYVLRKKLTFEKKVISGGKSEFGEKVKILEKKRQFREKSQIFEEKVLRKIQHFEEKFLSGKKRKFLRKK